MNSEAIILPSGDIQLRGQIWGNPSDQPLLAIHGWLDNSASFQELAPKLKNYYVLALDLIGHGLSDHLPQNSLYTLESYVLSLLAIIDYLGWTEFSILGHSLGSGIGTAIAAALPTKVRELFLIDKLGPPVIPELGYFEQFQLNMQSRLFIHKKQPMIFSSVEEAIQLRSMIAECSLKSATLITERDLMVFEKGFVSRCDRRLQYRSHRSLTEVQCQDLMRSIKCPVNFFRAESGMLKFCDLSARENCIPHLKTFNIEGSHHVHIDEPERISKYFERVLI